MPGDRERRSCEDNMIKTNLILTEFKGANENFGAVIRGAVSSTTKDVDVQEEMKLPASLSYS